MVTDPNTLLSVYAALAENVYRRDSNNDQALSIPEIGELTGVSLAVEPLSAEVTVFGQDGENLGNLQTNGDYYYSERGFVGMIVQVEGKYVVVFRGTDTTLSGWQSVWESALGIRGTVSFFNLSPCSSVLFAGLRPRFFWARGGRCAPGVRPRRVGGSRRGASNAPARAFIFRGARHAGPLTGWQGACAKMPIESRLSANG